MNSSNIWDTDEIVEKTRRELRLSGFPSERDAWKIASLHGERITVKLSRCRMPHAYIFESGSALIYIPETMPEDEAAEALLEELAHVLAGGHQATRYPPDHLTDQQRDRLHRLWDDREEAEARAFVLAWKLPWSLIGPNVHRGSAWLARESGCSLEEVCERLRALARGG